MDISIHHKLIGYALHLIQQTISRTSHFQVAGIEHWKTFQDADKPINWASWHGMTMMLAAFFIKHIDPDRLMVILPDDWRGETLLAWVQKMGMIPNPMDLENRGMATARKFARMVRAAKNEGKDSYITPDGPTGPAYVVKPGMALLAQKAGAPILPVGAYTRAGYRLNRWDRYVVPYPYSRISIDIGPPIHVPRGADFDEVNLQIRDALHRVTMQAAANYYEQGGK